MIYNRIAKLEAWKKKLILIFIDLNILIFSVWFSFWLRMSNPFSNYFQNSLWIIPVICVLAIPIYISTGYYRGLLTYNNSFFIYKSSITNFLLVLGSILIGYFFNQSMPPRSIWPLMYIIIISLNGLVKIGLRDYVRSLSASKKESQFVGIYGAGSAGAQLINSLSTIGKYKIRFIIDDDKNLWGRNIGGIKIFSPEYLNKIKYKIDNILLAIDRKSVV